MVLFGKIRISIVTTWAILLLSWISTVLYLLIGVPPTFRPALPVWLFFVLPILAFWAIFTARFFSFLYRIRKYFKKLYAGDYGSGIIEPLYFTDELTQIANLANKTGLRLQMYDSLRAERVRLEKRTFDLLFQYVKEAIMIAHMGKQEFLLNPPMQALFDCNHNQLSFESVEKQQENSRFVRIFMLATLKDGTLRDATATLLLPPRNIKREVSFRIIPIKESDNTVVKAILLVTPV
jgi:hypothetical protein